MPCSSSSVTFGALHPDDPVEAWDRHVVDLEHIGPSGDVKRLAVIATERAVRRRACVDCNHLHHRTAGTKHGQTQLGTDVEIASRVETKAVGTHQTACKRRSTLRHRAVHCHLERPYRVLAVPIDVE